MGVWQGVAMDSLRFQFLSLQAGHPGPVGVARLQGGWPAIVFYPFVPPTATPYNHVIYAWSFALLFILNRHCVFSQVKLSYYMCNGACQLEGATTRHEH
jgi:hypothetical protein